MSWIKLHREMTTWEWYDHPNVLRLWIHLLLTVNYKDKKWRGIDIKRGQRLTSYQNLGQELNLTVKQVRTALSHLKRTKNAAGQRHANALMVTVFDYDKWQAKGRLGADQGQQHKKDKKEKKSMVNFDGFRKAYPGRKRGLETEFENFTRKFDLSVIDLLLPALEAQRANREVLKAKGEFVPQWPMLQTWINQERWTEEIPTSEAPVIKIGYR